MPVGAAGLQQQHIGVAVLGQPVGERAAGGARADDDVVVAVCHSLPFTLASGIDCRRRAPCLGLNLTTAPPREKSMSRASSIAAVLSLAALALAAPAQAQDGVAAWRVECTGDGKIAGLPRHPAAVPSRIPAIDPDGAGAARAGCQDADREPDHPASARTEPDRAGAAAGRQRPAGEAADPDLHQYRLLRVDDDDDRSFSPPCAPARS